MSNKLFSASAYRSEQLNETSESENKIQDIEMPSGFVFRGKKLDFEHCLLTGSLPMTLVKKYEAIQNKKGKVVPANLENNVSMAEVEKGISFSTYVLNHCLILPEIVKEPENDNQCRLPDIAKIDLVFFIEWATTVQEVDQAEGLEMFPDQRQPIAGVGTGITLSIDESELSA